MVGPFVSADWLSDHPEVVLVDVRSYPDGSSGREAYERSHLPGAVYVELEGVLAGPPSPDHGRHPLPSPEVFAAGMAAVGIGDDDVVVAYDDDSGAMASRLVWMLRVTGHQAALLDAGLVGWRGPRESGSVSRAPATFTASPWPAEALVTIDEVTATPLLDARPTNRFLGDPDPRDPRAGHIPGAVSLPCRDNVGADGRLLPVPELRARLSEAGVVTGWASSCGSGVTACHTLLLAEHLGLPGGRLYVGSWSQWAHSGRPAAAGG